MKTFLFRNQVQVHPGRAKPGLPSRPAALAAVCAASLGCVLLRGFAAAATDDTTTFWDKSLLDMELRHVNMKAASFYDAWDQLGRRFLVRTVLAEEVGGQRVGAFEFTREACTVRDLIGGILATYSDYTLTQDPDTGVLWFHPVSIQYESIMPGEVAIPPGLNQVPMLQGVLVKLQEQPSAYFRVNRSGIALIHDNAGAYPVTLRPGVFAMRDVVNMCCQASPSSTFCITLRGLSAYVGPGDILKDGPDGGPLPEARPGSLRFWRLGMGKANDTEPTREELLEALASPNAHERWVARSYTKAEMFRVSIERIINEAPHGRKAVWASLAMLSMFNLATPSPHMLGLRTIRKAMALDTAASLDRGTVVLAAMEMARVGDDTMLKKVAQWSLGPDELAGMYPDGVRIARSSSSVRAALKEANCAWPGLSAKEVRDMEEQKALIVAQ